MEASIAFLVFQLIVLIFSVMIHEIAHGFVAERLGDPTARLAGRLTLNPLKHIDPFGSIILPLLLFFTNSPVMLGWAKPVPYNPYNLSKDYKRGPLKVALAGPASNLVIFLVFGLAARILLPYTSSPIVGVFGFIALLNAFLAIFNLVPIPPLDGSHLLAIIFPRHYALFFQRLGFGGILLVFLFVFFFSSVIGAIANTLFVWVAGNDALFRVIGLFITSGQ